MNCFVRSKANSVWLNSKLIWPTYNWPLWLANDSLEFPLVLCETILNKIIVKIIL